jgi:hypothetical protein
VRPGFLISFAGVEPQQVPVYRVRDFAEDLQGELKRQPCGTVDNEDTATDVVEVTAETSRHLGSVAAAITRTLRRQRLLDRAIVTRRTRPHAG